MPACRERCAAEPPLQPPPRYATHRHAHLRGEADAARVLVEEQQAVGAVALRGERRGATGRQEEEARC